MLNMEVTNEGSSALITKDAWTAFSELEKLGNVKAWCRELESIDLRTHHLSKTTNSGKLTLVKKQLSDKILNALNWDTI